MKALQVITAAALAVSVQVVSAEGDAKYYACYDSLGSLKQKALEKEQAKFNSRGECRNTCVTMDRESGGEGFSVQAMTKGDECWCGNKLPNKSYKVDDSKCNFSCPGYPKETCGNRAGDYISVYITGLEPQPDEDEVSSTSSSSSASKTSSTSSSSPATVTSIISPTTIAAQASSSSSPSPSSTPTSSINKTAVAAGCVVGVLAIIAIGVGAFIILRKRRREQVEEEYRRSAAAREFGQKPASDHRLDPGMVQKRDSVGSIADNQDYSRRILKVTNPDG